MGGQAAGSGDVARGEAVPRLPHAPAGLKIPLRPLLAQAHRPPPLPPVAQLLPAPRGRQLLPPPRSQKLPRHGLTWLLDPAPLARGLLPPKRLAWNVARAAAAASTAFFCLSPAALACACDREACSATESGFRVRFGASLLAPSAN